MLCDVLCCVGVNAAEIDGRLGKFWHDTLIKRRIILVDSYCMCRCNGKSVDHILSQCDVAYAIWTHVSFPFLGFKGFHQGVLLIFYLIGTNCLKKGIVVLFGTWSPYIFCRYCGEKGIMALLRTWKRWWFDWIFFSLPRLLSPSNTSSIADFSFSLISIIMYTLYFLSHLM